MDQFFICISTIFRFDKVNNTSFSDELILFIELNIVTIVKQVRETRTNVRLICTIYEMAQFTCFSLC